MIDFKTLQAIAPLLHSSGVRRIKMKGVEIEFYSPYDKQAAVKPESQPLSTLNEKIDPVESAKATALINNQIPVDLRTDGAGDFDKILHWSSVGPDNEQAPEPELPLTNDIPLSEQN